MSKRDRAGAMAAYLERGEKRYSGLLSHVSAREVAQHFAAPAGPAPQPLPPGTAGRVKAADVGVSEGSPLGLFVIGDSGGVKAPGPQNAVSWIMQQRHQMVHAVLHVGDVVYFHGEPGEYVPQFYEPYGHLEAPILAIPGNHDGDVGEDDNRQPTGRAPLDTFLANFCTSSPQPPPGDPELEFARHTQTLPWCDWTVEFEAVTVIGLYSNVPSGGHFEQSQLDWFEGELASAQKDRPVIVMLHHPPYSVDQHHGGSGRMGAALDGAFEQAGRCADLVLSGHVHDYQRFTRAYAGRQVPYVVIGNSGYHNLHKLARDATPGTEVTQGVTFEFGDDSSYGFLMLTVEGGQIDGEYTQVRPGTMPDGSDAQSIVAADKFSIIDGQVH